MAFAYVGHNVVLEIQATIPTTQEEPAKGPMWRGIKVAYIIVALCYFPISIIGFWVFGNQVKSNILFSFEKPEWLIAMANLFVVIHLIGSYQVELLFLCFLYFSGKSISLKNIAAVEQLELNEIAVLFVEIGFRNASV